MELTAAGQRVVGLASQMVNLAAEAEEAVRQAQGGPPLLRVVATASPADAVVPALIQAFAARNSPAEATLGVAATDECAALLLERLADVSIGPRLDSPGLTTTPLLRYRLGVVARHDHPLRRTSAAPLRARDVANQDWFVDPSGTDIRSDVGHLLATLRVPEAKVTVFPNSRAAWAAAAQGHGLAPAIEHLFKPSEHVSLSPIPIVGLPVEAMWHVTTLTGDRRSDITRRLLRFVSMPDAMQAMFRADGAVPASKFKPPVYVTIWS